MAFNLYSHNKLTNLAKAYVKHRRDNLSNYRNGTIFGKEIVLVPAKGVDTWLEHYIVKAGVVSAGIEFLTLHTAISELLQQTIPNYRPEEFSKQALTWRIYSIFQKNDSLPDVIKKYLDEPTEKDPALRQYELAKVIAKLFDEYQSYLPTTLDAWGRGERLNETYSERKEQWQDPLPGENDPVRDCGGRKRSS